MIKNIFKSRLFIPLIMLVAVGGFFGVNAFNYYKFPVISRIEPSVAYPGELISIEGENFGSSKKGAEVRIAGARPLSDSYQNWSDSLIIVRVPSEVGSGMVTVETRKGLSNGVLFTNRDHIPLIISGPQKPGYPYLETIEPESGSIGATLTVSGLNYGHERGTSAVYFTAAGVSDDTSAGDDSLSGMIKCSEMDYDYESWDEQQIQVFIPDGASSGNIRILTDKGLSNALYFEVTGSAGTKTFSDKMGFQVEYGIDISGADGELPNGLDLWVPAIRAGLEQRNVETVTEPMPLWQDYLGIMRYHFDNLSRAETYSVSIKSWLERYNIETRIVSSRVKTWYNEDRRLYKLYTEPEPLIPSDSQIIIDAAASAVHREKNPYLKASAIYNYLLKNLEYNSNNTSTVVKSLEAGTGDSYAYSILFTAMCRASGIPTRPAAGVLVYNNKQAVNHYWAEFYLEAFGWIPVDPALGDGARFGNFPMNEELDMADYYFGSIDNHHINLTKGIIATRKGNYSLQTIYEESNGVKSYSSYWRAVRIIDWW
jgi:transglutaminase-like putative cysteine protease